MSSSWIKVKVIRTILSSIFLGKTSIKSTQQECHLILWKLAVTQKITRMAAGRPRWALARAKTQNSWPRQIKIQTLNMSSWRMQMSFLEGTLMITISYSLRLMITHWWRESQKSAFLRSLWRVKISKSALIYLASDNWRWHNFRLHMTIKRSSLRKAHQYRKIKMFLKWVLMQ